MWRVSLNNTRTLDLELAKSQTKDKRCTTSNTPMRDCRVLERLEERGLKVDDAAGKQYQGMLTQTVGRQNY